MAKNKNNKNNSKFNSEFSEEVVAANNKKPAQNSPGEGAGKFAKR